MDQQDLEQALTAMKSEELRTVLMELILALHAEDADKCYSVLRAWDLEDSHPAE